MTVKAEIKSLKRPKGDGLICIVKIHKAYLRGEWDQLMQCFHLDNGDFAIFDDIDDWVKLDYKKAFNLIKGLNR